ncbi:hypothetical protein BBJ28_00007176, partial [Nothophytophthora sp. Chile5]
MPLMPGSPRPGTPTPQEQDDGVYRSLFQQPLVEIPPAAPSYAWFEFLLHPEALQKHLATLRHQKANGVHSATSAIELVREFLDQAQLVADEGNVRNKRYSALLLVAAQVALQMQLPLSAIEQALPLHFQRLLLDGIVDFAEQPVSARNEFTRDLRLAPYEAHVLHNRWTLRAIVSQSQNGYLTCSTRGEGEDLSATYQVALGDLMTSHLQIAQNIQAILMNEERQKLPAQTQLDAFYDLGLYFFSFNGFEKAYTCFSRALELAEDGEEDGGGDIQGTTKLSTNERANLEGYLAACEAVLEAQSLNEGPAVLKTPKLQVEMAWEARDWDKVVQLLESDMVAPQLTRLPQGYRTALEQQALRLLRSSSNNCMEDDPHLAVPTIRLFYKRVAMGNAMLFQLLQGGEEEEATTLEICVCTSVRLLQDEVFHSVAHDAGDDKEAEKRFSVLARFVLVLSSFAFANAPDDGVKARIKTFVVQLLRHFPCMAALPGASELLRRIGGLRPADDLSAIPLAESLGSLLSVERHLRDAVAKQRAHFRSLADVGGIFAFRSAKDKDAFVAALHEEVLGIAKSGEMGREGDDEEGKRNDESGGSSLSSRNLLTFCAANNCWELLEQCRAVVPASSRLGCDLEFAVACGALTQFLSSLASSSLPAAALSNMKSSNAGGGSSPAPGSEKVEFSIAASNKFMAEILLKWRELLSVVRSDSAVNAEDEKEVEGE